MKGTPEKHPEFDPETYTNPILEECYRIKAEISAKFKTQEEFFITQASIVDIPPHDALQSMSSAARLHLWVATSPLYPHHPPVVAVESGRISQGFQAA